MDQPAEALKNRTRQFALRIIRLIRSLPSGPESRIISHQLLRLGTSVAANYQGFQSSINNQQSTISVKKGS